MMTKFAIAIAALVVLIGTPAFAADMAVKAPPPPTAPVFSWVGGYAGVELGAKWTDTTWTTTSLSAPPLTPVIDSSSPRNDDPSGFRWGGYVGYNWQLLPRWLWGVEADWAGANKTATAAGIPGCTILCIVGFPGPQADTSSVKMRWDVSIRARLGYLVTPDLLAYATGGISWQEVEASATCAHSLVDPLCVVVAGNPAVTATDTTILTGWTVGGGLEYRVYGNWLLRGEYRYSNYGTWTGDVLSLSVPASQATVGHSLKVTTQIATGGITYKFPRFALRAARPISPTTSCASD